VPGNFFQLVPAAMEVERTGLASIADAVNRGDGDGAAAAYEQMMRRQADNVVAVFRDRGVLRESGGVSDTPAAAPLTM
jgi:hypothetical protein